VHPYHRSYILAPSESGVPCVSLKSFFRTTPKDPSIINKDDTSMRSIQSSTQFSHDRRVKFPPRWASTVVTVKPEDGWSIGHQQCFAHVIHPDPAVAQEGMHLRLI